MERETAEEFLVKQGCQRMCCDNLECNGVGDFFEDVQPKDLIEFTKIHVEAALKAASENVTTTRVYGDYKVNKESILNAYPLELIK